MRVILIASQKGGAGKSTLAAHFGALAYDAGRGKVPAMLIDADPQGSLSYWGDLRGGEAPAIIRAADGEAPGIVADAKASGVEVLIVDTAPHNAPALAAWVRLADLVVVPVRPAVFDLAAAATTFETAKALKARAVAVINAAPPPGRWGEPSAVAQAREVLAGQGVETLKGQVSQRASLAHALIAGQAVSEFEPEGSAAAEIAAIWRQVDKMTKGRGN
jgi:chromosome partitioning protein